MSPTPPFWVEPMFWLYFAPCAVYWGCLLLYGLRSRWRASGTGRAMFTLYASLVAILTLVVAIIVGIVPDGPIREFLRSLTLGAVTIAGAVQFVTILRLQRRDTKPTTPHPTA